MKPGTTVDEPARCAGLRRALLHDWHDRFPIDQSPFHMIARQMGGSLREVIGHCHTLRDEGALDAIRVRWSPTLERVRWRCGLPLAHVPPASLLGRLAELPGVTAWEWVTPLSAAPRIPRFWLHLSARDHRSARRQLELLEEAAGVAVVAVREDHDEAPEPCTCAQDGGPCSDHDLARQVEAGLPVVPRPYRSLSLAMHRSEREVLASLRRWSRAGRLQGVGFDLLPPCRERHGVSAVVGGPPVGAGVLTALLRQAGIAQVQALRPAEGWPYPLWIDATGAPAQAQAALQRALLACGLGERPRVLLQSRQVHVRSAPLLFADEEGAAAGSAAAR